MQLFDILNLIISKFQIQLVQNKGKPLGFLFQEVVLHNLGIKNLYRSQSLNYPIIFRSLDSCLRITTIKKVLSQARTQSCCKHYAPG